jgi:hypothetical protein
VVPATEELGMSIGEPGARPPGWLDMGARRARILVVLLVTAALMSACGASPDVSQSAATPRSHAVSGQGGARGFSLSDSQQAVDLAFPTP